MEAQSKPTTVDSNKSNSSTTNLPKKSTTIIATDAKTGESIELSYYDWKAIGSGSFGFVYEAILCDSQIRVAIKKVLQDKRFKNRELQIMRMVDHQNIVELKSFFYSNGDKKDEVFLNLVLEFVPETIYRANRYFMKQKQPFPTLLIKLYIYQLFRALAYIHSLGICHRDIKPQNLLLDSSNGILKLCDFGSAKILVSGESNVSYICSRYYRAPELIFGATNYTTQIDIWSTGCILAELALGKPIFPGESGVDQLVEIIKVLGTPEKHQVLAMNSNYTEHNFPPIKAQNWNSLFPEKQNEDFISLISIVLKYEPNSRPSAIEAMCHPFFNELRSNDCKLLSDKPLPPLFNFSKLELAIRPDLVKMLRPNTGADSVSAPVKAECP